MMSVKSWKLQQNKVTAFTSNYKPVTTTFLSELKKKNASKNCLQIKTLVEQMTTPTKC